MTRLQWFSLATALLWGFAAVAQVPGTLSHQGLLTDAAGTPLPTGDYAMTIKLYSGATTSTSLWQEVVAPVGVRDGVFSVTLGKTNPLNLAFDQTYFLGVTVGSGPELTPRTELTSVPYSLKARSVADGAISGSSIANGHVVRSLNGLTDAITLAAGSNVSVGQSGNTITIGATGGSGDGHSLDAADGSPADVVYVRDDGQVVVGLGAAPIDPNAVLHVALPSSGNYAHVRVTSPGTSVGFGLTFAQPSQTWSIGQNIGNWSDGRFKIVPEGSSKWMTMMPNGNVGLLVAGYSTPFARFQVAPNGSLDNGGALDLTKAGLYIGESSTQGMAFDQNSIQSVGDELWINSLVNRDVLLVQGGGDVGIGVENPLVDLHVGAGKDVLFGADLVGGGSGGEKKAMWLSDKAAIRAGALGADAVLTDPLTFWDPANVGDFSVAMGWNTKASNFGSVALGYGAGSTNIGATAAGSYSLASGNASVAMGQTARASGDAAVAMGKWTKAQGDGSVAMGGDTEASGFRSVAIGEGAVASGQGSVAMGRYTRANALASFAVGSSNVGGGNPSSWELNEPLFEVGNSPDATPHNALTILKSGRVGLETHQPQTALHLLQVSGAMDAGIRLDFPLALEPDNYWDVYVDHAQDLNFAWGNVLKTWIADEDGLHHTPSDRRLKTQIRPMNGVLDRVLQLVPSTFRFQTAPSDAPDDVGFIAQEVAALFPDLVSEKDGYLSLAYADFGVLAIKAIQEQQALIDDQQATIRELTETLTRLEERVSRLER